MIECHLLSKDFLVEGSVRIILSACSVGVSKDLNEHDTGGNISLDLFELGDLGGTLFSDYDMGFSNSKIGFSR